jgi:hypothetical protein
MDFRNLLLAAATASLTSLLLGSAASAGCYDPARDKATPGVPSKIAFENRTSETLRIYWIDYDGGTKLYSTLSPGNTFSASTFMTHNWIVTTLAGACVGNIFHSDGDRRFPLTAYLLRPDNTYSQTNPGGFDNKPTPAPIGQPATDPVTDGEVLDFDCIRTEHIVINKPYPDSQGQINGPFKAHFRIDTGTRTASGAAHHKWPDVRISPTKISVCDWFCNETRSLDRVKHWIIYTIDRDTGRMTGVIENGTPDDDNYNEGTVNGRCVQQ